MKADRVPRPRYYNVYWASSFIVLVVSLGETVGSAVFSLYKLAVGYFQFGVNVFSVENLESLSQQKVFGYFSFSIDSIFSLFFLLVLIGFTQSLSIYIVAQFVLPVKMREDRRKARDSFLSFINGESRVAIFVKEGKVIASRGESEDSSGGVILVDLSSAVALSQQEDTQSWNIIDGMDDEVFDRVSIVKPKQGDIGEHGPFVDAQGPGLVFIKKGQKISTAIDLRPQSRSGKVLAYTRNGIQISAQVSVTFNLSQEPETIVFGYVDKDSEVELRWLDIEEIPTEGIMRVRGSFDLDPHDVPILKRYASGSQGNYFSPEKSFSAADTPYKFYRDRVFKAAYSKARSTSSGKIISWHEAPLELAAELFRNELLTVPYEDLYVGLVGGKKDVTEAVKQNMDTLKRLKDSFSRKMRLKGIVQFQYVTGKDKLAFREGEVIAFNQMTKHEPISLTQHNLNSLRSIGVVIKTAGFGNVQPTSKEIKDNMIDAWKARWEKEVKFIDAERDLEYVRIQNRNRAQIQQEMTHLLSSVFQGSHTDEALALRVFQALESATANPGENNDMSPKEVIGMLDSLHKWLLIDRKDLQPGADDFDV
ncbi:MAG: hypothetical protein U0V02_05890 [Anaerolineales bacterium]